MQTITTIGLDIAKCVFQIHGVDAAGNVIVRRQLKRYVLPFFQKLSPCLIGIEACASSHHWSRELKALGHTVRLMPAAYVKPYGVRLRGCLPFFSCLLCDVRRTTVPLERRSNFGSMRFHRPAEVPSNIRISGATITRPLLNSPAGALV
jgi:hypothetical protein